jgi:oligopeptide transport system substrate-binding protein
MLRTVQLPLVALVLLLAALSPLRTAADDDASKDTPGKGELRIAGWGPLTTLDPAKISSAQERYVAGNLFDQLYEHDHLARPYKLRPALAAALPEISEDGLIQTIRLKPGVRFVDDRCFEGSKGRAVTAHDIRFCILRMMDATIKSPGAWMLQRKIKGLDAFVAVSAKLPASTERYAYRQTEGYPAVKGVEVVDDLTLRLHLLEPAPQLGWLFASAWLSIYAPESIKTYGTLVGQRAVGTGPYRVTLFVPGQSLLLRRSPSFRMDRYPVDGPRGSDLRDAGKRLPRNETVRLTMYKGPLQVWTAFTQGEADYAQVPRDAFSAVVNPQTGHLLPHLAKEGVTLHRDPVLEIFYDAFNWRDPIVGGKAGEKGRAIRYAICLASDEHYALTRLYTYRSERVRGPILPEMTSFDPLRVNESMRSEDETEAEALAAAREVLADAGYDKQHPVPTLKMHILNDKTSGHVFDVLKRQVARVGIPLESVPVDWPTMQKALKERTAQMWTSSWGADHPDAQNFLQLFYGPNAPEPNYTSYANAEVDELYVAARQLPPGEERDDLLNDIEAIVLRDAPWRYRFRRIRWTAVQPWLRGYRYNGIAAKSWKHLGLEPSKQKGR